MDTAARQSVISYKRKTISRHVFTGEEEHGIALTEAAKLTRNFRLASGPRAVKGFYFGREILERMLAQELAVGIRIYHAQQPDGKPTFVLSGVEGLGNDLFNGVLAEEAWPCPPWCSSPNPLNASTAVVTQNKIDSMRFTGGENHFVTLAEATRMIEKCKASREQDRIKGFYFSRKIFSLILAQSACVGVRIYYALRPEGLPTLVLVGVEADGSDLFAGVIGEEAWPCPPWCSEPNPLNR